MISQGKLMWRVKMYGSRPTRCLVNSTMNSVLMPTVTALARRIAAGPPVAIRLAKHSLYANAERDLKASLEGETSAQNICFETEDAREGIRAFIEKRDPLFRGR